MVSVRHRVHLRLRRPGQRLRGLRGHRGDCVSIGVDTDMSQITETCLTSAMKMLTPAVYGAIKAYYNDTFPGGTSETLTINEDAVGLPMESSRFKNFTQADYDAIVEVLKADKDGVTSGHPPRCRCGWQHGHHRGCCSDPAVCDGSGRRVNDYEIRRTR